MVSMHPASAIFKELPQASNSKPLIVLVHDTFADATSFISHPREVANLIEAASSAVK
jgi:hypothetical protein